jgi:TolA-binding protein
LGELQTRQAPPPMVVADPQIKAAYENSDYDQVINLYQQMTQVPGQTPALETTYQYAQALLKNHQEAEAARVLDDLLARVRQQPPGQDHFLLPVLQLVADLGFIREEYDHARKLYEEVIRASIEKGARKEEWAGLQLAALQPGVAQSAELKDFAGLLKNYLAYVPKRDGYAVAEGANRYLQQHPTTRLTPNVNVLRDKARVQADSWLNRGLQQAGTVTEGRSPQEEQALVPVVSAPSGGTAPPTAEGAVPSTGDGTPISGQGTPASPPPAADSQSLQAEYDQGVSLLQAKQYDQALERFTRLQRTALEDKARPMIIETSKQAGQAMRQKAAELFFRASNSRDPNEKRKLLLSSRDLLQNILNKYPQSGLDDKVQRNLARIDADLRALEASNAQRPVSSGGAYVPPGSGGGTL